MQTAIYTLAGTLLLFALITLYYKRKADRLREQLEDELRRGRSLSTVYGQISEQWFPLMDGFPYDSQSFRFIGSPVDGIQFEEDRIVFCEFKTNRSSLTPIQRRIKQLIESRQVYWEEFNFRAE